MEASPEIRRLVYEHPEREIIGYQPWDHGQEHFDLDPDAEMWYYKRNRVIRQITHQIFTPYQNDQDETSLAPNKDWENLSDSWHYTDMLNSMTN